MAMPNFIRVPEVDKSEVRIRKCPLLNRTVGNPFIRTRLDGLSEVAANIYKPRPGEVTQLFPVQEESRAQTVRLAVFEKAWNGPY
jgi:hypothetical protein